MIRAIQKQVNARTVFSQLLFDVLMDTSNVVDPVKTPCDPSLVGHHRNREAGPIEPGNRLCCPFDELDSVDRADVPVVNDNGAVAVKEDTGPRRSSRTHIPKTGHRSRYHVTSPGSLTPGLAFPSSMRVSSRCL